MRTEVTKQMQALGVKSIRKLKCSWCDGAGEDVTYNMTTSDTGLRVIVRKLDNQSFTTIRTVRGNGRTINFQEFSSIVVHDAEGPSALEEAINNAIKKAASIYKVKRRL